jgi:hypothetical protein
MKGTKASATLDIDLIPPNVTNATRAVKTKIVTVTGTLKAKFTADDIAFT